jgi:hypothetical protein
MHDADADGKAVVGRLAPTLVRGHGVGRFRHNTVDTVVQAILAPHSPHCYLGNGGNLGTCGLGNATR